MNLLFLFLKYLFRIWNWGLANSFWDHVIKFQIIQMNCQDICTHLVKSENSYVETFDPWNWIEYSFSRNSYVCLIWIFIFETDRAQIYSVQKKGGSSRNRYTVKKRFLIFLSPAGMSCTKLSLGGNNDVIYKLFPPWECLVSDISAADGNVEKLFLRCSIFSFYFKMLKRRVQKPLLHASNMLVP